MKLKFPIKLNDDDPSLGRGSGGEVVFFGSSNPLTEGDEVGGIQKDGDEYKPGPPFGVVVRKDDGLWVEKA